MRKYELTVVLPGNTTEAKKKSIQSRLEKIVEDFKGKLGKADDWGKLDMAYEIKGESSGIYLHFPLELVEKSVGLLDEKLRMEGEIIRYLLVKKNK